MIHTFDHFRFDGCSLSLETIWDALEIGVIIEPYHSKSQAIESLLANVKMNANLEATSTLEDNSQVNVGVEILDTTSTAMPIIAAVVLEIMSVLIKVVYGK